MLDCCCCYSTMSTFVLGYIIPPPIDFRCHCLRGNPDIPLEDDDDDDDEATPKLLFLLLMLVLFV